MLTEHAKNPVKMNSLIATGTKEMVKVSNFQALLDNNYMTKQID